MKRNLFSRIFTVNKIILYIFFGLLFSFNILAANGRVLIKDSLSGLGFDTDILYISTTKLYDYARNEGEEIHGNIKLSPAEITKVESFLRSKNQEAINGLNTNVDKLISAYEKRPDDLKDKVTINPSGWDITSISVSEPNEEEKNLISEIKNDPAYKKVIVMLNFVKSLYPTNYEKYFKGVSERADQQYYLKDDFGRVVAKPLGWSLIYNYTTEIFNEINSRADTPAEIALKNTIETILNLSKTAANSGKFTIDANGMTFAWFWEKNPTGNSTWTLSGAFLPPIPYDQVPDGQTKIPDNQMPPPDTEPARAICGNSFTEVMNSAESSCSVVAYLVNLTLSGLSQMFNSLLNLATGLMDWVIKVSIYNFNDWVTGSGAYDIWRKVILALVTSLLLPIVFYLIIRMLIDNDTEKIKKILPRVLITALFVYFSFYIVGWLIDQSNIITIMIRRSMGMADGNQSLGESLTRVLQVDTAAIDNSKSMGDWGAVPYYLGKLVVNLAAIFVIFQGAILLFVRSITLLLSMIFSPVMLVPEGIDKSGTVDKYKKMLITYFTNGLLMGPIFMLLVLIAQQIAAQGNDMIKAAPALSVNGTPGDVTLGSLIVSVIAIIVLQIAITVAKNLSGEIGQKISGKISAFAGNVGFGISGAVGRGVIGGAARKLGESEWMKRNGGTAAGKALRGSLKSIAGSSFDMRNTGAFKSATSLAGMKGTEFGKGSTRNATENFRKRLYKEQEYHDFLNDEGKEKNLKRLRSLLGPVNGAEIAKRLEERSYKPDFEDRIEFNRQFNNKFDKANKLTDPKNRKEELEKVIDEHFKKNGKGEKYFSTEIEKPENKKFKDEFEKINKDKNLTEEERKKQIMKVVADFEDAEKKKKKQTATTQNQQSQPTAQATQNQQAGTTQQAPGGPTQNVTRGATTQSNYQTSRAQTQNRQQGTTQQAPIGSAQNVTRDTTAQNRQEISRTQPQNRQTQDIEGQNTSQIQQNRKIVEMQKNISNIEKNTAELNKTFGEGLTKLNNSLIQSLKNKQENKSMDELSNIAHTYATPRENFKVENATSSERRGVITPVREALEKNEDQFGDEFRAAKTFSEKRKIVEHLRQKSQSQPKVVEGIHNDYIEPAA